MSIFAVLCLAVLSFGYFVRPVVVVGTSMEPTYYDGDLLSTTTNFTEDDITVGAIVCVKKDSLIIKRIIGMPGDTIYAVDNNLYVNDILIATDETIDDIEPFTLLENEYYILGDNISVSYDSRSFGAINFDDIKRIVKGEIKI